MAADHQANAVMSFIGQSASDSKLQRMEGLQKCSLQDLVKEKKIRQIGRQQKMTAAETAHLRQSSPSGQMQTSVRKNGPTGLWAQDTSQSSC